MVVTDRQQEFLDAIAEMHTDSGRPPMMIDLARRFGISKQGASNAIAVLVRKGLVRVVGNAPHQSIEVLDESGEAFYPGSIPLLGNVAAGYPILAVENRIGNVQVDRSMLRRGAQFALRVKGDSMIDAGIYSGDNVVIKPQSTAEKGQIVLAVIGEEATIKRLSYTHDGKVKLKPENEKFKPIVVSPDECQIQGIVIGLVREIG